VLVSPALEVDDLALVRKYSNKARKNHIGISLPLSVANKKQWDADLNLSEKDKKGTARAVRWAEKQSRKAGNEHEDAVDNLNSSSSSSSSSTSTTSSSTSSEGEAENAMMKGSVASEGCGDLGLLAGTACSLLPFLWVAGPYDKKVHLRLDLPDGSACRLCIPTKPVKNPRSGAAHTVEQAQQDAGCDNHCHRCNW